jgi:hypothetical protein
LPLTRRLTYTSSIFILFSFTIVLATMIHNSIHGIVSLYIRHIIVVDAKAGSATRTPTLSLVMSGECISTSKTATALGARMRAFSGVKLGVTLQVMQTAETSLACWAFVRLLLAVGQQMTFEIVVSREVGGAVWTFVALGGWRLGAVLVPRQTHLARRCPGVVLWLQRSGEGEGTVAGVLIGIGGNVLVMLWRRRLLVLGRAFHVDLRSGALHGRCGGSMVGVVGAKAGEADGARLHVVARHAARLGDDQGLLGLFHGPTHVRRRVLAVVVVHGRLGCTDEALDDGMRRIGT